MVSGECPGRCDVVATGWGGWVRGAGPRARRRYFAVPSSAATVPSEARYVFPAPLVPTRPDALRLSLIAFALLAGRGAAQTVPVAPAGPVAEDGLPQVAQALPGHLVTSARSFSQGVALDARGRLWCLVSIRTLPEGGRRDLWLFGSGDDGGSWQSVAIVPQSWSESGAIAGEPGTDVLHLAWGGGLPGDRFMSALYRRFDTERRVWLGEAEALQRGTADADQYGVWDLAVGDDGAAVALVSTRKQPPQPWVGEWAAGLFLRAPQQGAWQGPFQVNTASSGVWCNLQLVGGRAHISYRTQPGHRMIAYRSFALGSRAFEQPGDVQVSVAPDTGLYVANGSALHVGPDGGRTILYPAARAAKPDQRGQLLIAHCAPGRTDWQTVALIDDPGITSADIAHEHFALVRGPGAQAIALYSKVGERHRVLYRRVIDDGKPMDQERVVAASDLDGAYARIVPMRDPRLSTRLWAVVAGEGPGAALGVRAVLAPHPLRTRWHVGAVR